MAVSALRAVIGVFHRDPETSVRELTVAFTTDYTQFAKANNREPLNRAVESLSKSKADKAIASAVVAGYKAGNLVTGYIGASAGPFAKQPDDVQAKFIAAIEAATLAFSDALETSGAFVAKTPKTDEEKAEAKAKARAAKAEAIAKAIDEKIQAGELFHADSIGAAATLGQLSTLVLIDELAHRNLTEAEAGHLDEVFGLDLARKSLIEAQRLIEVREAEAETLNEELIKVKADAATLKEELIKVKAKAAKAKAAKAKVAKARAAKAEVVA